MAISNLALSRLSTDWRSQDLIEVLPAAVYVCNADAVVVSYNRRAAELWGREPVIGDTDEKYCGAHRLYQPDGTFLPHRETPMEWVLRTGEAARNREVVIERPDASRITVLVNIAPLFDEEGKLVGAVNCFQDLDAQMQMEHERARLTEELHQSKKMDALGQLMAGVAHDFNNLLTAMLGNLQLLEKRVTDEGALKLLEGAMRVARRGAALNEQLLAFARKQPIMPKPIDLYQVLAQMRDLLQATIGDMIRLEIPTPQEVWPVLVDSNQIELVILNLAINARDAMPFGGALTIGMRNATFSANDHPPDLSAGEYTVLSIGDTGTGMTEEVRAKALEPFFTTKGPGKGSGLGLSMALGMAREAGGGLGIVSQPGQGTSIEIYLPRADTGTLLEHGSKSPPDHAPVIDGEIVLVVDDDDDVREVICAMLVCCGYGAIEAENGAAAIKILDSGARVDLMLVDIAMPGSNGIETARRARQRRPNLPVLFSSGAPNAARLGGDDIDPDSLICKPYRLEELLRKANACLGRQAKSPGA